MKMIHKKIISNNLCKDSRESGIHASGSNLTISGNAILNSRLYGVLVSATPYDNPRMISNLLVAGNTITFGAEQTRFQRGIGIRNCNGYVVNANVVRGSYKGIEFYAMDKNVASMTDGIVTGNVLSECRESVITVRGGVAGLIISSNSGRTDGPAILYLERELSTDPVISNNLFELTT